MAIRAWRLPWHNEHVPHAVLDVLRGCNITCRACYNTAPAHAKSLDEIQRELQVLTARRRLDSIALLGGEPTLHPQLCEIVRIIKARGISVELFTNGLLLESELLTALHAAGTDLVFLHIDAHQKRPDVASMATETLCRLRAQRAAAVARAGMEVGLTITAYDDAVAEIDDAVRFVLGSPHVDYLLITLYRDVPAMGTIAGDLDAGMRAACPAATAATRHDHLDIETVCTRLAQQFELSPFATLGSSLDPESSRWVSYLVGSVIAEAQSPRWSSLRASAAEKLFLATYRILRGRYPFFLPRSPARFRLQLLLSALSGGRIQGNLSLFLHSLRMGRRLRAKRLLLQCPAEVATDGTIIHCASCPDATIRQGRLVPLCVSDQIASSPPYQE
jgi:pyruvate-formate lyase-activating enzyme